MSQIVHPSVHVPALIAAVGDRASYRFLEFFTVQIKNSSTRRAYARAVAEFIRWLESRNVSITKTTSVYFVTYIKQLSRTVSALSCKLQLLKSKTRCLWRISMKKVCITFFLGMMYLSNSAFASCATDLIQQKQYSLEQVLQCVIDSEKMPGPPGQKGDKGDRGEQGAPGITNISVTDFVSQVGNQDIDVPGNFLSTTVPNTSDNDSTKHVCYLSRVSLAGGACAVKQEAGSWRLYYGVNVGTQRCAVSCISFSLK